MAEVDFSPKYDIISGGFLLSLNIKNGMALIPKVQRPLHKIMATIFKLDIIS